MTTYWLLGEKTASEDLGSDLTGMTNTAAAAATMIAPPMNSIGAFSKMHTTNNVVSSSNKSVSNNIANHNNVTASTPLLQGDNS